MRNIITILIGILIISCNNHKKDNIKSEKQQVEIKQVEKQQETTNFDWLVGKWKRLNDDEGKETFENWTKNSKTEYTGIGFTMQNKDTIKQERIRFINSKGKWNLFVKVPEEKESIIFEMTEHNESQFICVNNEIDFPNKIKYWKSGDNIKAIVSNSEIEIPFEFEKIGEL
ncbi:DUF6265 family protein [Aquimarina sp. ERC-38]|uniref:DUF6265 family protein n=1 Tax=Aquimarina sp. ERC-38 TaxID=2949996 RepID=UPI002245D996|nr:DUF6265 family protein [Aquimarina sp. ERC-38]UZO79959.1 DUF6265 family protein [Aquimarina sp. ERC-38]